MGDAQETLDKLQAANLEGQATVKALHMAIKDIHAEYSRIEEAITRLDKMVHEARDKTNANLTKLVKDEVQRLRESTNKAIEGASEAIYKRFDGIAAIMLGEEEGDDGPSLRDLASDMRKIAVSQGIAQRHQRERRRSQIPPALRRPQ